MRCVMHICKSNLLYDVDKYKSPDLSMSILYWHHTEARLPVSLEGFTMGPMVIGLWQTIHVLIII